MGRSRFTKAQAVLFHLRQGSSPFRVSPFSAWREGSTVSTCSPAHSLATGTIHACHGMLGVVPHPRAGSGAENGALRSGSWEQDTLTPKEAVVLLARPTYVLRVPILCPSRSALAMLEHVCQLRGGRHPGDTSTVQAECRACSPPCPWPRAEWWAQQAYNPVLCLSLIRTL